MFLQRPQVAVLGSAREPSSSLISGKAFQLGREIGRLNGIVLTGGCTGLPHKAALGARTVGGLTLAVSPAANRIEHIERYRYPTDSDVTMFTGMGNKGRNVVLMRSADIAIFLGGGIGTLNEFTIAFDDFTAEKVIGILSGSGLLSDSFFEIVAKSRRTPAMSLLTDSDPKLLAQKTFQELSRKSDCKLT
ncbi:MAG: hypothetical protein M1511_20100 [Deltaproteobacteria bacterium]|nr:hypothetical protein [Deltaproteobacteria bacterium]